MSKQIMISTVDGRITKQNAITLNTPGAVSLENNILRTRLRSPSLIICVSTGICTWHIDWLSNNIEVRKLSKNITKSETEMRKKRFSYRLNC